MTWLTLKTAYVSKRQKVCRSGKSIKNLMDSGNSHVGVMPKKSSVITCELTALAPEAGTVGTAEMTFELVLYL